MLSEQQKDDFKWYKGEMVDLYNELGHCFAVIRYREVVATFPTFDEAVDYAIDTYEPRTFIVQEIGPDPSAYTMQIASSWVVA
jgi:hypothetical protein